MAKNSANIKITADTKEAEKGINSVTANLNKLAKNKTVASLGRLGQAFTGVTNAASTATAGIKSAVSAVNSCISAYQAQAKAETLLETAVKNNPYLKSESAQRLKEYASQLGVIGTIGDETLIPLMAQLVSAGRSEAEIMDIMSASLDVSASGAMSLESAVKNLNKTYSGTAGELGETLPKVKELTAEQMKQGQAVKVVAEAYKGMAEQTANQTGGFTKLKNSWGDFLELLGKPINSFLNPIATTISKFVDKVNTRISELQNSWNKLFHNTKENKTEIDFIVNDSDIEKAKKKVEETKKTFDSLVDSIRGVNNASGEELNRMLNSALKSNKEYQSLNKTLEEYKAKLNALREIQALMGDDKNLSKVWKSATKEQEKAYKELRLSSGTNAKALQSEISMIENGVKRLETEIENVTKIINVNGVNGVKGAIKSFVNEDAVNNAKEAYKKAQEECNALIKAQQKQQEEARKQEEEARKQALQKEVSDISDYGKEMLEAIKKNKEEQNALIKAGMQEEFDYSTYLSVITDSYKSMLSEMSTLTFEEAQSRAQEYIAQIVALYESASTEASASGKQDIVDTFADEFKKITDEISNTLNSSLGADEQIKLLESLKEQLLAMSEGIAPATENFKKLEEAIRGVDNAISSLSDSGGNVFSEWLQSSSGQMAQSVLDVCTTMNSAVQEFTNGQIEMYENEKNTALSNLEEQFESGLISEEEYNEQKEKIEKEAAKKKYQMELAQWTSNIATTTGQIAMSIVTALANSGNPYVGIPMAAAYGALGAAQLATLIASKPSPPSYATGGVIGGFSGASLGNDNTYIHARSGEMLLNASQQKNLFDTANGGASNGGLKVSIKNYMGDSAEVSTGLDENTLNIIIDKRVTSQLENGGYTEALTRSDVKREGVTVTN